MKKIKLISISILSVLLFFTSCKKDDVTEDYVLTAKIDGNPNSFNESVTVSVAADQAGFYQIIGADDNGNRITLNLASPTSEGTYSPSAGDDITSLSYVQNSPFVVWGASENVGAGTVTITENNATYMEGTFFFTGVDPSNTNSAKEFTEGSFKAKKL